MRDIKHKPITHVATRRRGVSGMMRVRNDSEFIESCIESCIDALDELVIVYNDCTDNSPEIIQSMVNRYPHKIHCYEYTPKIRAWNLDKKTVTEIIDGKIPEKNTLAGYYNFALEKTSFEFVMKIDADQIYFTDKLRKITDAYRTTTAWYKPPIFAYLYWIIFILYFEIAKKSCLVRYQIGDSFCQKYFTNILKLIKYSKKNSSLSGYNVYIYDGILYHSYGKSTPQGLPNILVPYNGEGDHPIFKVTNRTYFVPSHDLKYERLINSGNCVIEKLINVGSIGRGSLLPMGVCWLHLNSNRRCNKIFQEKVFKQNLDSFIRTSDFLKLRIKSIINSQSSEINWILFDFIHKMQDGNLIDLVLPKINKIL